MENMQRIELHYSETPNTFTPSFACINLPKLKVPLYIFIFHEDENIPHIHLINIENQINIAIRLDKPYFYYHDIGLFKYPDYYFSREQKDYIYNWMIEDNIDSFGNVITNWFRLKMLYITINSKFEEEYIDKYPDQEYDWEKIFINGDDVPDYRNLE